MRQPFAPLSDGCQFCFFQDYRGLGALVVGAGCLVVAAAKRVLAALDDIRKEGLTIAVGGNALEGPGYFIEPTVVTDVPAGAAITSTEIFGLVVSVETFSTEEEAVTRANETVYRLAASVWTTNAARALSVPRRLDFGTVWVNSHLVIANEMPWGGFKGSGYGRDLSTYALEVFSRTKHVMYNHG